MLKMTAFQRQAYEAPWDNSRERRPVFKELGDGFRMGLSLNL
jgi:hypothetical protein